MTTKNQMIEYTAYAVENDIPRHQLINIFKDKNVNIDDYYIDNVIKLRGLYTEIYRIYNHVNSEIKQFMIALKNCLNAEKTETFESFYRKEIFIDFFKLFSNLVFLYGISISNRSNIIKQFFGDVGNIIAEYDYYYEKRLIKIKQTSRDENPYDISSYPGFVCLLFEDDHLLIWNLKTDETKDFRKDINIDVKPRYFGNSKFAICGNSNIYIFDFNTGQYETLSKGNNYAIENIEILDENVIIADYEKLTIMDNQNIKKTFDIGCYNILIIDNKQFITHDINNIYFFDSLNYIDKITRDKSITTIKQFGSMLLIGFSSCQIEAIDIKTRKSIWVTEEYGSHLIDIIIRNNDIIVISTQLVIVDNEGRTKYIIDEAGIQKVFVLPNDQIVISQEGIFGIWNIEKGEIEYEDAFEHYSMDVSINGEIILLKRDGEIKIYS